MTAIKGLNRTKKKKKKGHFFPDRRFGGKKLSGLLSRPMAASLLGEKLGPGWRVTGIRVLDDNLDTCLQRPEQEHTWD